MSNWQQLLQRENYKKTSTAGFKMDTSIYAEQDCVFSRFGKLHVLTQHTENPNKRQFFV